MKNRKYKRIKGVIWAGASTGIVTGMIFMGANPALAETTDLSVPAYSQNFNKGMHIMHRWNSTKRVGSLATQLGLNPRMVKEELKSGKPLKQILQDNGVDTVGLQKALHSKKHNTKKR